VQVVSLELVPRVVSLSVGRGLARRQLTDMAQSQVGQEGKSLEGSSHSSQHLKHSIVHCCVGRRESTCEDSCEESQMDHSLIVIITIHLLIIHSYCLLIPCG